MSAATIVFCDIVSFSKKSTDIQADTIQSLSAEVTHELYRFLRPAHESPHFITIPTGDGMVIALMHGDHHWQVELFHLIGRLMTWRKNRDVGLRIGVHTGLVKLLPDINNRPNIVGSAINRCQRVMDAANDDQVLFSQDAYNEYIGNDEKAQCVSPFNNNEPSQFKGPFNIVAKHNVLLNVYVMHLGDQESDWWDNADPEAKDLVKISLTPMPRKIDSPFCDSMANAKKIALVQLTGERLLERLLDNDVGLSEQLKKFWIFMPNPQTYTFEAIAPMPSQQSLALQVDKWRAYMADLTKTHPDADIQLKLYEQPTYFGGSFFDWDRKGGKIHLSPYVWGVGVTECPGFDMAWLGEDPSPVYETYVKGLDTLNEISTLA